jgi:hypothetical protein
VPPRLRRSRVSHRLRLNCFTRRHRAAVQQDPECSITEVHLNRSTWRMAQRTWQPRQKRCIPRSAVDPR